MTSMISRCTVLCTISLMFVVFPLFSSQDAPHAVAHLGGSGGYALQDPLHPTTRFLIDRYCQHNKIQQVQVDERCAAYGYPNDLHVTQDGTCLADMSSNGSHCIFNLRTGVALPVTNPFVITRDGNCLITGSDNKVVRRNLATGEQEELMQVEEEGFIDSIALTPDEKNCVIISSSYNSAALDNRHLIKCFILNLESGKQRVLLDDYEGTFEGATFTPDSKYCVMGLRENMRLGSVSNYQHCVNLESGVSRLLLFDDASDGISTILFAPSADCGVILSRFHHFFLWSVIADTVTYKEIVHFKRGDDIKDILAITSDGQHCVIITRNHRIVLFNRTLATTKELAFSQNGFARFAATSDGNHGVLIDYEGNVSLLNLMTGEIIMRTHCDYDSIRNCLIKLMMSPDNSKCFIGFDHKIVTWNIGAPELLKRALGELSVAQVALLGTIIDLQKSCRTGFLRKIAMSSHNPQGEEADSYHAYRTLPDCIRVLIEPYVHIVAADNVVQ